MYKIIYSILGVFILSLGYLQRYPDMILIGSVVLIVIAIQKTNVRYLTLKYPEDSEILFQDIVNGKHTTIVIDKDVYICYIDNIVNKLVNITDIKVIDVIQLNDRGYITLSTSKGVYLLDNVEIDMVHIMVE